jgi:hypothetical protein
MGQSICQCFGYQVNLFQFSTLKYPLVPALRASKPCILVLLLILQGVTLSVNAQKEKKGFKKGGVVKLNDSLTIYSQSDIFDFPNVNKLAYYQNDAKLKKIRELDVPGQEKQMYAELKEYVKNFGIENFSKNVAMIWRLAKLSETHGPPGESLLLYKLVLKHHQQGLDIKNIYKRYEQLDPERKENYVPLGFLL